MKNLQKRVLFSCFLLFTNYSIAQQRSNPRLAEEFAAGSSYFFYQRPVYPRDCQEVYQQCSSSHNASGVYNIKPDGLVEPFEVFCDNTIDSEGWTTVLRRMDGSVDFNRSWAEYQKGFGFIGTEFWLGQERLSHIVNQKTYELRFDIINSKGTLCYLSYSNFRISDGWGDYKLASLGRYSGTADFCLTSCPTNMEYGNCTCQATCEDPRNENRCNNICTEEESCLCPEGFLLKEGDCVEERDCSCFLEGVGVIKDGGNHINSDCSRRCNCTSNHLTCEDLRCSNDATCLETDDSYQCQCNPGFAGDGQDCIAIATDCMDLYNAGERTDGVYTINPTGWTGSAFEVYCEMESNGGGWTVFQRRVNGSVDFFRDWASYKDGFGTLSHEFWLGNDKIHTVTQQANYQLRIDLLNPHVGTVYHLYNSFTINNVSDYYRINVGEQTGKTGGVVGNPLNWNNGQPFSTYDQDNDDTNEYNCAVEHKGGWWYKYVTHGLHGNLCWKWSAENTYRFCSDSNLNGDYQEDGAKSVYFWYDWNFSNGCGITRSEMKIRPFG